MEDLLQLALQADKQNIPWAAMERALASFVRPMSQTLQNPEYHAEGDVWTHTKMVCQALVSLEGYQALEPQRRQALFLAAVLHDIGKIRTTRLEDGSWTSPNHTLVGSKMARAFLWQELGLCGTPEKQQLRETVCQLIRYHSAPPHAIDDPGGRRKLMSIAANGQLCPMFTVELLCLLCRADVRGRVSRDPGNKENLLELIQLARELSREQECLNAPYAFPSEHTRYAYLSGRKIPPQVPLYDNTWGQVILMSGLPGTGKDTWIRENCPDLPMISLDELRKELHISPKENQSKVIEAARAQAKELLRRKQPFVWNATNLSPMLRRKQVELFSDYGAATRIVYLETDHAEQRRRNAGRAAAVPESALCRMQEELILPEMKEARRVDWYCV